MEYWKRIPGTPYEISSLGRVKTLERIVHCATERHIPEKILSLRLHNGYVGVGLRIGGKTVYRTVHRLVAKAFIPNPNGYKCVNHIDGNKQNNSVDNLEWCNHSQNLQHAYNNGLKTSKGAIRISYDVITAIREYSKENPKAPYSQIAKIFGVSKATAWNIINNKRRLDD